MMTHPLANRLKKRFSHLKKWAKRTDVTCFRVYHKGLPDYPLVVEWCDGVAVMWWYIRKRDESLAQQQAYEQECAQAVRDGLNCESVYIKQRGKQKGVQTQYRPLGRARDGHIVQEAGLSFELNLSDYLDVGLFLDHRDTRARVRQMSDGKRVLNLFCYTGSFTCYAIAGGASETVSVDMSSTYTQWTERNLALNGTAVSAAHQVVCADVFSYVPDGQFDVIVCDPPTFSNSKKMDQTFSVDRDYPQLLKKCLQWLAPFGVIVFSTNSTSFKMKASALGDGVDVIDISAQTQPVDFSHHIHQCFEIRNI